LLSRAKRFIPARPNTRGDTQMTNLKKKEFMVKFLCHLMYFTLPDGKLFPGLLADITKLKMREERSLKRLKKKLDIS